MNKKEFGMFAMALQTYYPKENLLPNTYAMDLWKTQLEDIPFKVAEAALNKWVATNKWSPTIADIREMTVSVTEGETPLWSDGWGQVQRAIKKYGSYNQEKALESMDEITRQTVRRLGFIELCRSENVMADRANFRMIFEQIADRKQKAAQISTSLHDLIEGIQQERKVIGYESKRLSDGNQKT